MKKDFFTGFVLLLPVVITIVVVVFVVKALTNPFMGALSSAFDYYGIFNQPFLFLSGKQVLALSTRLIVLLGLAIITLVVGLLGRWFLMGYFVQWGEYLIHRIPIVNKLYKAVKDVVQTIFSSKDNRFSEVVLVPFPHAKAHSIGLITNQEAANGSDPAYQQLVSVFVPGTPNPAMGFMLLFRRDQLVPIDMKVPDALKFLVSCGVIVPQAPEKIDDPQLLSLKEL